MQNVKGVLMLQYREEARRVYYGAVFDAKMEIVDAASGRYFFSERMNATMSFT